MHPAQHLGLQGGASEAEELHTPQCWFPSVATGVGGMSENLRKAFSVSKLGPQEPHND